MKVTFGKSFEYFLYPLSADETDFELFDDAAPTIHVYDGFPTRGAATTGDSEAGASLVETISSWTDTDDAKGKKIEIAAIPDPAPESSSTQKKYYIAINARLRGETQSQLIIREFTAQRLKTHESRIDVSVADLLYMEPKLGKVCGCPGDLEAYIDAAETDLRSKLSGCDFTWGDVWNPSELSLPVIYEAISSFYYGESMRNDRYKAQGERYEAKARAAFKALVVKIDTNKDGKPETRRTPGFRSIRMVR